MFFVRLRKNAQELRNPVPAGTIGTLEGVHNRYIWVHFEGTGEAQTVLPEDVENYYPELNKGTC